MMTRRITIAALIAFLAVSLLSHQRSNAAAREAASRPFVNQAPALQGTAAIAHLRERGQYDSLRSALTAALSRRGVYPATASLMPDELKLTASDGAPGDLFGFAVAISGATIVVGAESAEIGGNRIQGAAYVFERRGGSWVLTQKLTASDGAEFDKFGGSVAVSGATIVVGATDDNNDQGAAYVFKRQGGSWVQTQKLTASDGEANDEFGSSVAISGATIVVGADHDWINGIRAQGAAHVFERLGGSWIETQKLTANDGAIDDSFGQSVGVSGATIVVGASSHNTNGNPNQGAAYVFTRQGWSWFETQKLTASDGAARDSFGRSVAVSGATIVVGAIFGGNSDQGAAYVFGLQSGTWVETQQLTAGDGVGSDRFGSSVAVSGATIVVGAERDDIGSANNQGSAYVFTRQSGSWIETQHLIASDGAFDDQFGWSVAVSGATIVAGASFADIGGNGSQGAAYVFTH